MVRPNPLHSAVRPKGQVGGGKGRRIAPQLAARRGDGQGMEAVLHVAVGGVVINARPVGHVKAPRRAVGIGGFVQDGKTAGPGGIVFAGGGQ